MGSVMNVTNFPMTPASNITVQLRSGSTVVQTTKTNSSGRYEVQVVPVGTYNVTVVNGINTSGNMTTIKLDTNATVEVQQMSILEYLPGT